MKTTLDRVITVILDLYPRAVIKIKRSSTTSKLILNLRFNGDFMYFDMVLKEACFMSPGIRTRHIELYGPPEEAPQDQVNLDDLAELAGMGMDAQHSFWEVED